VTAPADFPEARSDGASDEATDLAGRLLQLAAFPANAEVVDAALRLVVALAHATVAGADGVSVMLSRAGSLATVAASDETISGMDADQYATGQGPCVSAATDGHRIYVESLESEARWPEFIPRAKQRGINSILSMPLLTRGRPLGALNIYSNRPGAFSDPEQPLATLCAQQASDLLASAALDVSPEDLSARLRNALQIRQTITLATGVIMTREGVSAEDAHTLLLQTSHQSAVPLREQAQAIVASTQRGSPPGPAKDPGPNGRPTG
jgi:GAF domain-containing protein